MVLCRCPLLPIVTTRDAGMPVSRSSTRPMNAKGPRWFTAMVDPKPSPVTSYRTRKPPTLFTSRSRWSYSSCSRRAAARTDASDAKSTSSVRTTAPGEPPQMRSAAAAARPASRQANTRWAPRRASASAIAKPSPVLAPVTRTVRPCWAGMSSKDQRCRVTDTPSTLYVAIAIAGKDRTFGIAVHLRPSTRTSQWMDGCPSAPCCTSACPGAARWQRKSWCWRPMSHAPAPLRPAAGSRCRSRSGPVKGFEDYCPVQAVAPRGGATPTRR
ncbi:hypothetical protein HNR02_005046 [Amycolatopsis endophytica]|uniref:Uncharacterized protein n=1 Tax=Amycolatopsis endophytica TaxID=860233 RepID=A0A853B8T3_9PSEU|nr:hypothetical protein [Amycolatopsis endophytica]